MTSEQLGLELVSEGETLRLYDPQGGEYLRTYAQAETQRVTAQQRAEAADRRAQSEQQRAEVAEAELNRLRQELDALRRQQ